MAEGDPITLEEALKEPFDAATAEAFLGQLNDWRRLAPFVDLVIRKMLPRDHKRVFWGDRMLTLDKAAGFLDDPAFAKAWKSVRGAHVYDQYDNRESIAWRLHTLVWAAREALALLAGDFVECGVFQGDMSWVVYNAAPLAGSGRRLHLFDSFEGLDPAQVREGEYGDNPGYVEIANSYYRRPDIHQSVVDRFASAPEVFVHKGFLPGALAGAAPEAIAWLHIDLNSAAAEIGVLEALFDRVVPGGYVIFDDYGWSAYALQKAEEDAFFAARGYRILELPTGQGLVVKRP